MNDISFHLTKSILMLYTVESSVHATLQNTTHSNVSKEVLRKCISFHIEMISVKSGLRPSGLISFPSI